MRYFWNIVHWAERGWNKWTKEYEYPLIRLIVAAFSISFSITFGFFVAFAVAMKVLKVVAQLVSL